MVEGRGHFPIPSFMDYLLETRLSVSWLALVSPAEFAFLAGDFNSLGGAS
jgi:hypothetical protein